MAKTKTVYAFESLAESPGPQVVGPIIKAPDGTDAEFIGGQFETTDAALAKAIEASGLARLVNKAKIADDEGVTGDPESTDEAPEV